MASLDSEDRPGGGEIVLLHDLGRRSEVGRDSDALENGRCGKEGLDVAVAKVVFAFGDGSGSGSWRG